MIDGLIVDAFCGGGGASLGIMWALHRDVSIAINHDPLSIKTHKTNHPNTTHLQEDIFTADLEGYVNGRTVSLYWGSPSCTDYSRAKGGKPKNDQQRILPWAVHKHVREIRPLVIACENVVEIQQWEEYAEWVNAIRTLGYDFDCAELNSADFGARTARTRWFAVFRRDGEPISWPSETHSRPGSLLGWNKPQWMPVRPLINTDDVGERTDLRRHPLSEKTMLRMESGRGRWGDQWLMAYYGTSIGSSLDMPLPTITTHDRFALVSNLRDGDYLRMLTPEELKLAQGFPREYVLDRYYDGTKATKRSQTARIGNSVVPLMAQRIVEANAA